jgi:flagellar basal-body rod modification protein FlgD
MRRKQDPAKKKVFIKRDQEIRHASACVHKERTSMQAQLTHPAVTALDTPSGSGSTSSSSTSGSSTEITANDFLTLLVAEMKNQDPTATTDPNAYIDQLVQVNSLEQLIQINKEVGSLGTSSSTSTSSNSGSSADTHSVTGHLAGAAHVLANALAPHHENTGAQEVQALSVQNQMQHA